jgi:segregation and condensation protein A
MPEQDFSVKLTVFEGPFDLLLFFIERDELDIYNIPIAKITDDFLSYIHQFNTINMELASEFIYVAATLMRIKAKMLLPRPDLDDDGNELDLQKDLVLRLIEYKRFKNISEAFKVLEDQRFYQERRGNISEDASALNLQTESVEDLSTLNLYKLLKTYQKVMGHYLIRTTEVKHTVVQYPYNIEEQKTQIANLLLINKQLDFKNLLTLSKDKVQFVYNFLAVLEMLQQQLVDIQIGFGFNQFSIHSIK